MAKGILQNPCQHPSAKGKTSAKENRDDVRSITTEIESKLQDALEQAKVVTEIDLAAQSKQTVIHIQDVTEKVMLAVDNLASDSNSLLNFITEYITKSYDLFEDILDNYGEDASYIDTLVTDFSATSEELLSTIDGVMNSIHGVSTATIKENRISIEGDIMYEDIKKQASAFTRELCEKARLKEGQILVIGCSSSEVCGDKIGSNSNLEVAESIFAGIYEVTRAKDIYLAAQCCEHLNRALIIEQEAVLGQEIVNVVPQPKAGGSFATTAYQTFQHPVAVEELKADAGIDIGDTLIGMHLKRVAVPVRLEQQKLGQAHITAARVRPKFIGGERAHYDEDIK